MRCRSFIDNPTDLDACPDRVGVGASGLFSVALIVHGEKSQRAQVIFVRGRNKSAVDCRSAERQVTIEK